MYFIVGERNDYQYLLVLTKNKKEGVFISEVRYQGKLLPILIKDGKITELSPMWGHVKKVLVEGECIIDFQRWLKSELQEHPGYDKALTNYNLAPTVVVERGTLEYEKFQEIFFTDEKHRSSFVFKFGNLEDFRDFPTARGSKWLAKTLLSLGYQTYRLESKVEEGHSSLSFKEIFSSI